MGLVDDLLRAAVAILVGAVVLTIAWGLVKPLLLPVLVIAMVVIAGRIWWTWHDRRGW